MFDHYMTKLLEGAAWRVEPVSGGAPIRLIASKDGSRVGIALSAEPGRDAGPEIVRDAVAQIDPLMLTRAAVISQAGFTAAAQREAAQHSPPVALIARNELFRAGILLDQLPEPEPVSPPGSNRGIILAGLVTLGLLGGGGGAGYYYFLYEPPVHSITAPAPLPSPTPAPAAPAPAAELARILEPPPADNTLSNAEITDGWELLFDGRSLAGWIDSSRRGSVTAPIEQGALRAQNFKEEAIFTKRAFKDFELRLDYRVSEGFVGGVGLRLFPTTRLEGSQSVRDNGLEISLSDTGEPGYESAGAIRDFVAPKALAGRPAGEWNQLYVRCFKNVISVELNGQRVTEMDLDNGWDKPHLRPDGSRHRLGFPIGKRSRIGAIAIFVNERPSWFKNIKIKPLNSYGI